MSENQFRTNCLLARRRHDAFFHAHGTVTLADVQREMLHLDGKRFTESEVAGFLLGEPLDAGRRGMTGKSLQADAATRRAAEASRLAEDSDDADLHQNAERAHHDAASYHAACVAYHRQQRAYHRSKTNPTPADASASAASGLEAALEDKPKKVRCPNCGHVHTLSPDDSMGATHVNCPNCRERIDVSEGGHEEFDETGAKMANSDESQPVATKRTEPQAMHPIECARSLPSLLDDGNPGNVIMYMPAGQFVICPAQAGKPVTVCVLINRETAETMERQRALLAAGGNAPYFSIEHSSDQAAFWPTRFFYDVRKDVTGKVVEGVWAEGTWTAAGREAVLGRSYRQFSPTFYVSAVRNDSDNPVTVVCNPDARLNFGAVLNDPAFGAAMSPLWSENQPQARA
jgi:ribosomal protein S27E